MNFKLYTRLGLAVIFMASGPKGWSQSTASIVGTVIDPSGAHVPACQVQAVEAATKIVHTAECNAEGYYVFPSLRPANYDIGIAAPGFGAYTDNAVVLSANQTLTVDASLSMDTVNQSVEVEANTTLVDTTTGTTSTVIDQAQIHNLPLDGRNAANLTTLVAGAVIAPDARATQGLTIPLDVTVSTNGTRGNQISYRLDGANNTDELTNVNAPFPFPDALQEFSMQTSNYSAEYGDSSGAAVNIVTKSGTNSLHGSAFEYVRNQVFNARNYFSDGVDTLKRNQYGFTIGGPVVVPFYNGRNKTFFFTGYQATRLRNSAGGQFAAVPTDAMEQGDYSALLDPNSPGNPYGQQILITDPQTCVIDPATESQTCSPFPGNIIPQYRLDQTALNLYKYLPSGGLTGSATYTAPNNQNYNEWIARVDHTLGTKDQLTFRFFEDNYTKLGGFDGKNLFTLTTQRSIPATSALAQEEHTFSSSLINDARMSYLRINGQNTTPAGVPSWSSLGSHLNQDPAPHTINEFTTNEVDLGAGWPVSWVRNQFEWSDDLHWVRGRNNLAFGFRVERDRFENVNTYGMRPGVGFYGDFTGLDYADLSLGLLSSFYQQSPTGQHLRTTRLSLYGRDSIHLTPRFTLDVGLRYEPFIPWSDTHNEVQAFSLANFNSGVHSTVFPNAPVGLMFPGDKGFLNDGAGNDLNNISPRLGFAWDVFGSGKTSVRGGSGVFYDSREVMAQNMVVIPAPYTYIISTSDQGTLTDPYQGMTDPFPYTNLGLKNRNFIFPSTPTISTYDQAAGKYVTPVTYNWNLIMEQQLRGKTLVRLAYVGSRSNHELETYNTNPAVYIPGSAASTNSRRVIQGYGAINTISHDANSIYHALQFTASHRIATDLTLLANYTWSKSLDTLPYGSAVNSGPVNPVLPNYLPNFHSMDRGPSEFDYAHVVSISYVWIVPKLRGSETLVRAFVNGWQTTGIISARSGEALTITASGDISQTGQHSDRAVFIGTSPASAYGPGACVNQSGTCINFLNPASFTTPTAGNFGNVGKGEFRGPHNFDWDAGILRNIPVGELANVQFKAEFFNVLNHTNFSNPETAVNSGNFGTITSSNDPRIGQLALTISF
jgi:hypothetical protein